MKTNENFHLQELSAEETKQLNGGIIFPGLITTIEVGFVILKHKVKSAIAAIEEGTSVINQ